MARTNPALLQRLKEVLGLERAAVYRQIAESNTHALEPNLAALAFAHKNGVPLGRFSTAAERAEVRPYLAAAPAAAAAIREVAVNAGPARGGVAAPRARALRPARARVKDNTVFVVHGRNDDLRKAMFEFLRNIGLNPLEWESAVAKAKGGNPYIADVLRKAMEGVQAIVVLLSPDDDAKLRQQFCKRGEKSTEGKLQGQARPNVLFEAGWAVGRFPDKTLLVQVGKVKAFTDIGGKHMLHLSDDAGKRLAFANRLKKFGCDVNTSGSDWLKGGKFKT